VSDTIVVLEMILQAPLVLEGAETEIAVDLVIPRVVNMVLQAVAILEDAFAEIAVILMLGRLLDVVQKRRLVRKCL
jgi:hypothetical protein